MLKPFASGGDGEKRRLGLANVSWGCLDVGAQLLRNEVAVPTALALSLTGFLLHRGDFAWTKHGAV